MKRRPAWRKWRERALRAERLLEDYRLAFLDKTGQPIDDYFMVKGLKVWVENPRMNIRLSNLQVPE